MTSLMPDTKPETPLTDHEAFDWSAVARGEAPPMPVEVVYAGFARGLETRLAAAERELAALRADARLIREFVLNVAGPAFTREQLHKEANLMLANFSTYGTWAEPGAQGG